MAQYSTNLKRARSSSPERLVEPPAVRRRLDYAPVDVDVARNGDVVLSVEHVFAGNDGKFLAVTKRIRVSAAILTQTSPVFAAMLDGHGFSETQILRKQGRIDLQMDDDNHDALLTVVAAIHGNRKTLRPKLPKMSVALLANIATLVDKYEWHDAIEVYAESWTAHLKASFPLIMGADVFPWMWISWVFGQEDNFKALTKLAMLEATEKDVFSSLEYPLPMAVTQLINRRRAEAINLLQVAFKDVLRRLREVPRSANADDNMAQYIAIGMCDGQAHHMGLFDEDQRGRSFESLAVNTRAMTDSNQVRFRLSGTVGSKTVQGSFKSVLVKDLELAEALLEGFGFEAAKAKGAGLGPDGLGPDGLAMEAGSPPQAAREGGAEGSVLLGEEDLVDYSGAE